VLVFDEAYWLSVPLFTTLRRLFNFAGDMTAPFALVLVGHTGLRHQWALRPLEAVRQRVTMAYYLRPYAREESAAYLQRQLQHTGITHPVFPTPRSRRAMTGGRAFRGGSTVGPKRPPELHDTVPWPSPRRTTPGARPGLPTRGRQRS
jgi:hypothetical protein